MNVSVSTSLGMKRKLTETAAPTVDVVGIVVHRTWQILVFQTAIKSSIKSVLLDQISF